MAARVQGGTTPNDLIAKVEPDYKALHRIADRLAPELRQTFLSAVQDLRSKIDPDRLLQLIAAGDQGNLGAFWQVYEQEMGTAFRGPIREVVLAAAGKANDRLGANISFDLTNPKAVQLIETQTATLVQDITEESRAAIREVLRQGFLGNADVPTMARRIRSSIGLTQNYATAVENYRRGQVASGVSQSLADTRADRYSQQLLNLRATTISRTETIRAANNGQQAIWQEARQQGLIPADQRRIWLVTPDDRLCPICEGIADENQDGVGINEPFQSSDIGAVMGPPAHPSCFPGDTLVASRDRVTGQSERWYDGELVVIRTAGGKELSATPNHPILTRRLWVAAGALHKGDDLVCDQLFERMGSTDDDYKLMPTRIKEIPHAAGQALQVRSCEVPVAPEDFHGDGKGSKVAVIRTYRLLGNRSQAALRKPEPQSSFVGSHEAFATQLASNGGFAEHFHATHGPTGRFMGGGGLSGPLVMAHLPPLQPFGLALGAQRYPGAQQRIVNSSAAHTELVSQAVSGCSSHIALDKIVDIGTVPFSGHVYSLETISGWHIAQGIIAHNCRCATALVMPSD